jgi:hypothetical protein
MNLLNRCPHCGRSIPLQQKVMWSRRPVVQTCPYCDQSVLWQRDHLKGLIFGVITAALAGVVYTMVSDKLNPALMFVIGAAIWYMQGRSPTKG